MSRKALVREIEDSIDHYSAGDVFNFALDFGIELTPRMAKQLAAKLALANDPHAAFTRFLHRRLSAPSR